MAPSAIPTVPRRITARLRVTTAWSTQPPITDGCQRSITVTGIIVWITGRWRGSNRHFRLFRVGGAPRIAPRASTCPAAFRCAPCHVDRSFRTSSPGIQRAFYPPAGAGNDHRNDQRHWTGFTGTTSCRSCHATSYATGTGTHTRTQTSRTTSRTMGTRTRTTPRTHTDTGRTSTHGYDSFKISVKKKLDSGSVGR